MKINEDNRRKLIDWSDDFDIATCKIIEAKEDCVLGEHYHKVKTERFMLVSGRGKIERGTEGQQMERHHPYLVLPGIRHRFVLRKGAILICLVDRKYDPNDDFTD